MLVVEDLDRIDPAHLFRILNIFSAHIDYCYKYGHKAEVSIAGNKFGLDNIVLVCDFSNIRKLFRHFYGGSTDFKGYIGKFLSSAPYTYSSNPQLSPSTCLLRVHVLSLLNYQIN